MEANAKDERESKASPLEVLNIVYHVDPFNLQKTILKRKGKQSKAIVNDTDVESEEKDDIKSETMSSVDAKVSTLNRDLFMLIAGTY
jgi:hypothetical protein